MFNSNLLLPHSSGSYTLRKLKSEKVLEALFILWNSEVETIGDITFVICLFVNNFEEMNFLTIPCYDIGILTFHHGDIFNLNSSIDPPLSNLNLELWDFALVTKHQACLPFKLGLVTLEEKD